MNTNLLSGLTIDQAMDLERELELIIMEAAVIVTEIEENESISNFDYETALLHFNNLNQKVSHINQAIYSVYETEALKEMSI